MLDLAWSEIALIAVVALVVIGPKDLPEAVRGVARGVQKLRRMAGEFRSQADELVREAKRRDLHSSWVFAITRQESAFMADARSHAGAMGLMQLMPATARRFGVTNAFDARQNIHGGVQYLAWLLRRFKGDLTLAAAGYNAGEGAVDRHGGVPPYSETRYYVQRVAQLADRYRGALASVQ